MAYDYYTIRALAVELNTALVGKAIIKANTRSSVLLLDCQESALVVQCRRGGDLRLLKKGHSGNSAQGLDAEKYLIGATISSVSADNRDRVIRIHLERTNRAGELSHGTLIIELLANKINCALISERTGEILGVWGEEKRMRVGRQYQPPQGNTRFVPGESSFAEFQACADEMEGSLSDKCRALWVGLDRQTIAELMYRAGSDNTNLEELWRIAAQFYGESLDEKSYIYQVKEQWHFTAIEPKRIGEDYALGVSLSDSIAEVAEKNRAIEKNKKGKQRLKGTLRKVLKAVERRRIALERDLKQAEDAEKMEKQGHVLLAHLGSIEQGAARVELIDIFDEAGDAICKIDLDRHKTPAENAALMLKRAKKYIRRKKILPNRVRGVEEQIRELNSQLKVLETDRATREVEDWMREKGYLVTMEQKEKKDRVNSEKAHPRQYTTSDGWKVLAGRNNKENDILTHKIAAQNDMWFHAHGYPGSHVVLRREGRKDEPSKLALEEAAAIAAFWSKGKSAKKVPVVYTQAKYVSKPRGGAPGQAVLKREKTLMAEPRLPS